MIGKAKRNWNLKVRKSKKKFQTVTNQAGCVAIILLTACSICFGADWHIIGTSENDKMLAEYFRAETSRLSEKCLSDIKTLKDWEVKRPVYRKQLFEMLGLEPLPDKTDLKPVITGKVEHEAFTVEKIYYQSRPGLYISANLYIPKGLEKPAPTILYVCGHSVGTKDGIRYGNKAPYQHHPAWFARHGYVCFIFDTVHRGEIEGIHHGTYQYKMWWWNSRGFTSAGVEAWNCIRAIDYLQTRKEVDKERIGVTGISGGGAYSWWISALDERIKVAVPVAGITDLQNHIIDGCVEGHCDCMFLVHTYRWDYPLVAALVAPRPLLISNSDKDSIFPLEGVLRLHEKVRRIYRLYNAEKNLGLHITEGPHKDTQQTRVHTFSWFNRFLKDEDPLIDEPAVPFFEWPQLKVFDKLPDDNINSQIHESFTPKAPPPNLPQSTDEWSKQREVWMKALREKSFRGWPTQDQVGPLDVKHIFSVEREGIQLSAFDFTTQPYVRLRLYLAHQAEIDKPDLIILNILDEQKWTEWLAAMHVAFADQFNDKTLPEPNEEAFGQVKEFLGNNNCMMGYVAPRGIGPAAWNPDEFKQTQIRRRFMLLGQTLDGMRVWDIRRAIQTLHKIDLIDNVPMALQSHRLMAGIALYASLFEPDIIRLDLWHLPQSHRDGPTFLNVLRYMDIPQAVAMAAERTQVRLYQKDDSGWRFPQAVAEKLDWPKDRFQVHKVTNDNPPTIDNR